MSHCMRIALFMTLISTSFSLEQTLSSRSILFPKEDRVEKSIISNFKFSLDVIRNSVSKEENVLFSPFGASVALGVTSLAAQGKTLDEIQAALNLKTGNGNVSLEEEIKESIESMKNSEGGSIDFATCIFTQSSCGIMPFFGRKAIDIYQSDIQQLNFSIKKSAAFTINNWVAKHTHDKIMTLVDENSLNPDVQVMITNAIYFRGDWKLPFNSTFTKEKQFKNIKNQTTPVQMMRRTTDFQQAYDSDTNTRVLSLPYADNKTSMIILLPRNVDGLPKLLQSLTPETLQRMTAGLTYSHVTVELPKFKLEVEYSLKSTLSKLGIKDLFTTKLVHIFNTRANLTGIVCNNDVYVNDVIQKSFIEVEETGTTAAAATSIELIPLSKPFEFTVDHPFAFLIMDRVSEIVLFIGSVFDLP
uniref:Serpin domain-containing protein n=1 Tax=Strigamia maritima TaxID=126957 RepID=T1IX53_STRMM